MRRAVIITGAVTAGLIFTASPAAASPSSAVSCSPPAQCNIVQQTISNYAQFPGQTLSSYRSLPQDTINGYRNAISTTITNYTGIKVGPSSAASGG